MHSWPSFWFLSYSEPKQYPQQHRLILLKPWCNLEGTLVKPWPNVGGTFCRSFLQPKTDLPHRTIESPKASLPRSLYYGWRPQSYCCWGKIQFSLIIEVTQNKSHCISAPDGEQFSEGQGLLCSFNLLIPVLTKTLTLTEVLLDSLPDEL